MPNSIKNLCKDYNKLEMKKAEFTKKLSFFCAKILQVKLCLTQLTHLIDDVSQNTKRSVIVITKLNFTL